MKNNFLHLLVLLIGFTTSIYSQEEFTFSGTVSEQSSNESLIGVNILIPEINSGTTTNEYGFFSLTLPEGKYEIIISYLGYKTLTTTLELNNNSSQSFFLEESTEQLKEIILTEDVERINLRKAQMSVNRLSINTIKQMPVVFGEVDVIKSITLLPGVTNAGEGSSGFNVRGGSSDQNLILLDEAIVFNSSHLFGFFSVFNPDAIKDIKLYKGGIPSKYGGRVSSVLDIYQKEGNSKSFHLNGGIGLVSSRLLAEGPIVKEKGSFIYQDILAEMYLIFPIALKTLMVIPFLTLDGIICFQINYFQIYL